MAAPGISNLSASPEQVEFNGTVTVSYTLRLQGTDKADISVSSSNSKLSCVSGCSASAVDEPGPRTASFKYSTAATANESATITVKADGGLVGGSDQQSTTVRLVAKQQAPQTVAEVSGKVVDSSGAAVSGASVALNDSQHAPYVMTTGSSGTFKFTGTASNPISPGQLVVGAKKGNSATKSIQISASAGQRITGQTIRLAISPSPSASASASPEEDIPTEDPALPSDDGAAADSGSPSAGAQAPASNESSGGGMAWLLIVLGGLLVALGVGAIVLLWMRRKENNDDDEDDDDNGGGGGGGRGYRGGDATRVANRAGAGADATMVAGPSLADAPTMMHNRPLVDDEFPDPYGAPLPPQGPQGPAYGGAQQGGWDDGGYGSGGGPTQPDYASGGGYGNAPSSGGPYGNAPGSGAGYGGPGGPGAPGGGYGNAPSSGGPYGNAPSSGGAYGNAPGSGAGYGGGRDYGAPAGAPAGGYPGAGGGYGDQRYDEPTGRYTGGGGEEYAPPADPYETSYGQPGSSRGYGDVGGGQAGGYGQQGGGYGGAPSAGSGYDAGEGYGQQGGGGYGAGGYEQPNAGGGYDAQGGGYGGRVPEQRGDGYGQQGGGYYDDQRDADDRTRVDGPPQQQSRSGRRTVDWLDD